MAKKSLLLLALLVTATCVFTQPTTLFAQDVDSAELEEQLKNGLLARAPNELAFISRVVSFVDAGALEVALVKAAFQYARPKKPRPYPYFEAALRQLAKRNGVEL